MVAINVFSLKDVAMSVSMRTSIIDGVEEWCGLSPYQGHRPVVVWELKKSHLGLSSGSSFQC